MGEKEFSQAGEIGQVKVEKVTQRHKSGKQCPVSTILLDMIYC